MDEWRDCVMESAAVFTTEEIIALYEVIFQNCLDETNAALKNSGSKAQQAQLALQSSNSIDVSVSLFLLSFNYYCHYFLQISSEPFG